VNKKAWLISLVALFAVLGWVFYTNSGTQEADVASTDLSGEQVAGVQLPTKVAQVNQLFGEPVRQDPGTGQQFYQYQNAVSIGADTDGTVRSVEILKDSRVQTAKGIGIGHTIAEIEAQYGTNNARSQKTGAPVLTYVDKEDKLRLEFWLAGDKVTMVRLEQE